MSGGGRYGGAASAIASPVLLLAKELEARARSFREVAAGVKEAEARDALLRFAAEYEERAAAIRAEEADAG